MRKTPQRRFAKNSRLPVLSPFRNPHSQSRTQETLTSIAKRVISMSIQNGSKAREILGQLARREQGAYPKRSATSGQRSQRPKGQANWSQLERDLEFTWERPVRRRTCCAMRGQNENMRLCGDPFMLVLMYTFAV